jgi:hypothetical protein
MDVCLSDLMGKYLYKAKTEEKHQSLLEDLTSTNIFAAMTTNLPLHWYEEVHRSGHH